MSNETPERKAALENAQKQLDSALLLDVASLARKEDLPQNNNFSSVVQYFERAQGALREIRERDLTRLARRDIEAVISACSQFEAQVKEIRGYDLNSGNYKEAIPKIAKRVSVVYDAVMEQLALPLAFTAMQQTDFAAMERQARGVFSELQDKKASVEALVVSTREESDKALALVRAAAAEGGVSSNAQVFEEAGGAHEGRAQKWLGATKWLAGITVGLALGFLVLSAFWAPPGDRLASFLVSKLVVLSAGLYATVWCGRNYKACLHNETLNRHRANALKTFQAFVKGAHEAAVSDAILLQAAHAAFQSRPTGYEATSDSTSNSSPFVDIVSKTAAKAAAGGGPG